MQTSFDFTGLREKLGAGFDAFVAQWMELQQVLAGRGHGALKAGRILAAMMAAYGKEFVRDVIIERAKAPTWNQSMALIDAYDFFRDTELSDEQAAVLDSVVYRRMRRDLRIKAFGWIKAGKSAQEIDDLVEVFGGGGVGPNNPTTPSEADLREAYARQLEAEGYDIVREEPTNDTGAADIVARKGNEIKLVECKVTLDRETAIYAMGQLLLYSRTYADTRSWDIAFWNEERSGRPVMDETADMIRWRKVELQVKERA